MDTPSKTNTKFIKLFLAKLWVTVWVMAKKWLRIFYRINELSTQFESRSLRHCQVFYGLTKLIFWRVYIFAHTDSSIAPPYHNFLIPDPHPLGPPLNWVRSPTDIYIVFCSDDWKSTSSNLIRFYYKTQMGHKICKNLIAKSS